MSYIDTNRQAPFGAITIFRATTALTGAVDMLTGILTRRTTTLATFSPSQLEDIGISLADLQPRRPGILSRAAAAFADWNARRRTIAELGRLNDAQLDDIGLTRCDVEELRFRLR